MCSPSNTIFVCHHPFLSGVGCRYAHQRYNKPLFYITENGVSAPREAYVPLKQAVKDTFRVDYYRWVQPG
jgi:hypothetical protein